jgi:transketolase
MRGEVLHAIHAQMKNNPNIFFLTGDLGYSSLEAIENDFPDRFINVGVAEQNMIGIAAGLSLSGKRVYLYSIIPFLVMRCFEQIRNDLSFTNANVTLLGVGSGLSYGILSSTHFALEDIAVLRPLPNMTIFSPADAVEARLGIEALESHDGPVYFRMGKKDEPKVYENDYPFAFGQNVLLRPGRDGVIFSTGAITSEVLLAVQRVEERSGLSLGVVNVHTIKPLDTQSILQYAQDNELVITVEEHGKIGGLGSAVAEVLARQRKSHRFISIGTKDEVVPFSGTQSYLRAKLGLDQEGICQQILSSQ